MQKSFSLLIDQSAKSAITIADQDAQLPSYLLGGEKKPGYYYDGKTLSKWYWSGLNAVDGKRVLTFDPLDITPFSALATTLRPKALPLVRSLAEALILCEASFLDLSSGIIPLWRLWATDEGHILIMSQDVGDLFSSVSDEGERYLNVASWVHHTIHPPFSLIDQLTSLLYYSAAGIPPFFDKNTREDGFRALPLSYLDTGLDNQTAAFIDATLSMGLRHMREAAGNKPPQRAVSSFLEQTEALDWNLGALQEPKSREELLAGDKAIDFSRAQAKRANAKVFWRKRGWLIITITVSVLLVGGFVTGRVKEALAPPYTASYNQEEVIRAYYRSQSELDLQKMEASLARKVKNPASLEVTNLFVTRQTRQAYESINVQVNPEAWIAEGRGAIAEGAFIYGISDVQIRRVDGITYQVSATYWAPFNYEGEAEEGPMAVYAYDLEQRFTVEMGKKGWYEITSISAPEITNMRKIDVPTYPRFADNIQLP